MKKIMLSLVIASAGVGITSCTTTDTYYSPGYNSSYVYSTGYGTPYWGYGNVYGVGWNNNHWHGNRYYGGAYARSWHGNWNGARGWNNNWHRRGGWSGGGRHWHR
jgi:hypothetical protein